MLKKLENKHPDLFSSFFILLFRHDKDLIKFKREPLQKTKHGEWPELRTNNLDHLLWE